MESATRSSSGDVPLEITLIEQSWGTFTAARSEQSRCSALGVRDSLLRHDEGCQTGHSIVSTFV